MPHLPSRRRLARMALPAMICAALAAGVARAAAGAADDPAPFALVQNDPAPAEPPLLPRRGWGGMEHREAWAARRALHLADRLATMHVYLGITPQQEDAWRGFSQAVLAMVPPPDMAPRDDGAFDGIDRMARMMQRRAEAARAVADAAEKLKATMSPEQIHQADAAWAAMREHWEHHHHDWHHDRDQDR
jgi:hypothetical protein